MSKNPVTEDKFQKWKERFKEQLFAEFRIDPSDVGYDEEAMRYACFTKESPDELVSQLGSKYNLTPSGEFHAWQHHAVLPV